MNILFTEALLHWGGEQNKVLNEMRVLRDLGHEVSLFCEPNSDIDRRARDEGFAVVNAVIEKHTYHKTIPLLMRTVRERGISLVVANGSIDGWICAIARLFCPHAYFARERHNEYAIRGLASKFMFRHMMDKIIYVSPSVKKYLQSIGVSEEKLFFLPPVTDVKANVAAVSTFRREFGLQNAFVIGTLTSILEKKGVYDFARAALPLFEHISNLKLVFAGDGSEESVARLKSELGEHVKDAIITGFRDDVINVMKGFDIYVFASHSEGLPTVLLEAMSCSLPIVVYDKEPMNYLVKHGERGLCAKFKDQKDLSAKILEMANNSNLKEKCAKNASRFVSDNFSQNTLKTRLAQLVAEVEKSPRYKSNLNKDAQK